MALILANKEYKIVKLDTETWNLVHKLVNNIPELGYETVEDFANDAILESMRKKVHEFYRPPR